MRKIQVQVLNKTDEAVSTMMFLARLTQRGHKIKNMDELIKEYEECKTREWASAANVAKLPHGTIKRFTPITIAVVGASRRFLAQARTHKVGIEYVSASLQYSDYSGCDDTENFVVPYELTHIDSLNEQCNVHTNMYLEQCKDAMTHYKSMIELGIGNDTAGYVAPQSLRNILVMSANHEAWCTFINKRMCHRNTEETMYTAALIWEALLQTEGGDVLFKYAGPDCLHGACREGQMSCCNPINRGILKHSNPATAFIENRWPLLRR